MQDLGRLAIVVVQEAAERVPAPDGASRGARVQCQRDVLVEALVRARLIEQRRRAARGSHQGGRATSPATHATQRRPVIAGRSGGL